MKVLCVFVASLLAFTNAALPNLLELIQQSNATALINLIESAGLSDVISDQGEDKHI